LDHEAHERTRKARKIGGRGVVVHGERGWKVRDFRDSSLRLCSGQAASLRMTRLAWMLVVKSVECPVPIQNVGAFPCSPPRRSRSIHLPSRNSSQGVGDSHPRTISPLPRASAHQPPANRIPGEGQRGGCALKRPDCGPSCIPLH